MENKRAVSPAEVESMYGISRGTLANFRYRKVGPKYYKVGTRKVLYLVDDVENWCRRNPVLTADCEEVSE